MEAAPPSPCLVISPHRDDACFSLGGAIHRWQELGRELNDPSANSASLELLERIASRLMLCRQAEQAIRDGEAHWSIILGRS